MNNLQYTVYKLYLMHLLKFSSNLFKKVMPDLTGIGFFTFIATL